MYSHDRNQRTATTTKDNDSSVFTLSQSKIDFLKQIPRSVLTQAGFGDLNLENDSDDGEFLSQTSVNDSDYQVLIQDDFVDVMNRNINAHSPGDSSLKHNSPSSLPRDVDISAPGYNPVLCFNQKYY